MCCCPSPSSSARSRASASATRSRPPKRKGIWVGGNVPLGYESRDKKLVIHEDEAERVRLIFRRYLERGSIGQLLPDLRDRGIVTKIRGLSNGRTIGGIPLSGAVGGVTEIALREDCSPRHVNMTISLAFLAPPLVKAAVDGRLPHGVGLARLIDSPAGWNCQYRMLGLTP